MGLLGDLAMVLDFVGWFSGRLLSHFACSVCTGIFEYSIFSTSIFRLPGYAELVPT
jgi:hypothetical protein